MRIAKKHIIIAVIAIVGISGIAMFGATHEKSEVLGASDKNLPIVAMVVKAGYAPSVVKAPANQSFILRMTTKNTYDCSAALTIPKLKVDQFLPANGDTDIIIAAQPSGTIIEGGCSMGMYGFQIIAE